MKVANGQKWKHVPSGDERTVIDIVPYYVAAGCRAESDVEEHRRGVNVARLARVRETDGWIARDCRDSSDMILNARGEPKFAVEWGPVAPIFGGS